MEFPKQPGVYCFWNKVSNKIYVGSSCCLFTRLNNHLKNQQSNKHLQNAIKHYGIESFCITYQVLETKKQAQCLEQMLLDHIFKLNIDCYNMSLLATGGKVLADYSGHAKISKMKMSNKEHQKLSETNGGCKAKIRYALEVNNPDLTYRFSSRIKAEKMTGVYRGTISLACKTAKPYNGKGRWLFSDVSEVDLVRKFNNLTQTEIKGNNNYAQGFILIDEKTNEQSCVYYSINELYKLTKSNLCKVLKGERRTINNFRVAFCI